MGFMDKVKAAAQDVAKEAKKAGAQGKERIEDMQTKKKMDEAAKKLGYLIYRERTEATPAGSEADQLVAEITSLKAELEDETTVETDDSAPARGADGDGATAVAGGGDTPPAESQQPAHAPSDQPPGV